MSVTLFPCKWPENREIVLHCQSTSLKAHWDSSYLKFLSRRSGRLNTEMFQKSSVFCLQQLLKLEVSTSVCLYQVVKMILITTSGSFCCCNVALFKISVTDEISTSADTPRSGRSSCSCCIHFCSVVRTHKFQRNPSLWVYESLGPSDLLCLTLVVKYIITFFTFPH